MLNNDRPTSFAPYALGVLLSSFGGLALLLSAVGDYLDNPRSSMHSLVLLVTAPAALACFGYMSAIPRRRRRRRLEALLPDSVIVDVIVLPATRSTLQLDDELKRCYTVSLAFVGNSFTIWKRGTFAAQRCGEGTYLLQSAQTGTTKVSTVVVAALIGTVDNLQPLELPVLSPRSPFNMATGSIFVDDVARQISASRGTQARSVEDGQVH